MKKQIVFLVFVFLAVLIIPVGTQSNASAVNAETQLVLTSEVDPPTLPDPEDYTYHASIQITAETWEDIIEEFDGMGTQWSPLKITGFYFEYTGYGPADGIFINTDVEVAYIDIEDCLFIENNIGILSYPSAGRVIIRNCKFIDNDYGVYLCEHAEQIVEDCLFYGGSDLYGAGLFLEEAFDVTVKECTFYDVMRSVYISWLTPTSYFKMVGCNIYGSICGIDIVDSVPGEDGAIVIMDNHIDNCVKGIELQLGSQFSPGTQGVLVKENEISHCRDEAIWIHNGASFNAITDNYIHDTYMEHSLFIEGHHNIIKSNKFEAVGIAIYCYTNSYQNEITWNVFLESFSPFLVADTGEDNLWDYNYYSDYEGDGTEPYDIFNWSEPENQDLHPFGPNVPYIPPTPPDPADYTFHFGFDINLETWDDIVEEFDGMGTQCSPLKIRGLYLEESGIYILPNLEDVYIDIEDCLFKGLHEGVLSHPSSGRIRIKNCVFIDYTYGVYLSEHAEQIVEDCIFYDSSFYDPSSRAVFLNEAYDVTIEDCIFYAVERAMYASWEEPFAHLEINRCDLYGGSQYGIHLVGNMESSYVGISRCNIYNSYYGILWNHAEVENSLIEIDECTIYDGIYGIYFDSVVTGPNSVVLIHDSEIGWCDEIPQSTAIYLTGGCIGIVIEDNSLHHCEYGIWFRQHESYNRISRNEIEYCRQAVFIQGLSSAYEARGNVINNNEIAHISHEAVWFLDYTSENIFIGNYLHDNEIGDAEQWNMFICGHHNIIKLNKFENLGAGHVAITLYFIDEICYENEITWNVFLDTDVTAISDESGVNILDYNYYADYEGDGSEPYVNQDLHPLGPELTYFFWLKLFFQYPLEVLRMLRWLV